MKKKQMCFCPIPIVEKIRESYGLSRKELASAAGISESTLYQYEKGYSRGRVDTIDRIENALNSSLFFNYPKFWSAVRKKRKSLNMTQGELAKKLHMKQPLLCNSENGKVKNMINVSRVAEFLKISLADYLEPIGGAVNLARRTPKNDTKKSTDQAI